MKYLYLSVFQKGTVSYHKSKIEMSLYINALVAAAAADTNSTDSVLSQLQNATSHCSNSTIGSVSYAMYCTPLDSSSGNCLVLPANYTTNGINCTSDGINSLSNQYGKATDQNCFISCTNIPVTTTSMSNTLTPDFLLMVIAFFSVFMFFGKKE